MERMTGLRQWVGMSPVYGVTSEHHHVLPWAVKGEGMSVNEAVYTGTLGPDGRR
jgi:hypothetical protein